jgi:hypothetical protein
MVLKTECAVDFSRELNPENASRTTCRQMPGFTNLISKISFNLFASGGQGGRFLKKLPPLDPPAKTFHYFYVCNFGHCNL